MLVIVSRLAETQQRTIKYETGLIALIHQLSLKTKISSKLFDQQSDHLRPINQYV